MGGLYAGVGGIIESPVICAEVDVAVLGSAVFDVLVVAPGSSVDVPVMLKRSKQT